MSTLTIFPGDCRQTLAALPAESVQCVVTSPPYYGLRDYGCTGQIGLEQTPEAFVAELVAVFREVRRVLKRDGTCWINLGDSYANDSKWGGSTGGKHAAGNHGETGIGRGKKATGLPGKNLMGIPWRVAFALQADGWILRQDLIWSKPNPMPESVTDRCTKSHEYLFLLSKSPSYYFDAEAIKEPCSESTHARVSQNLARQEGSHRANGGGKTNGPMRAVVAGSTRKIAKEGQGKRVESFEAALSLAVSHRNKRSVWTVGTKPYGEAHFATFPPDLIRPCILAGSRGGDTILDPFGGSGTTGMVALEEGRKAVLCELNPAYCDLIRRRCTITPGFNFTEEAA